MKPVASISDPERSRNVPTQFTPDDARRFYDRFGSKQDTQGFYENPALDDLLEHADFDHARSVLEFGCGTGSFARRLFKMVLPEDAHYLWSGHQRDHDRTGDQEAGAVAGSCRGATGRWLSRSPCAQWLHRSLRSDLCVRPPGACVLPPLDRGGASCSYPWWSSLHGQPDARHGSVLSVRVAALDIDLRPLPQARWGMPPDPFNRPSGTGSLATSGTIERWSLSGYVLKSWSLSGSIPCRGGMTPETSVNLACHAPG